MPATPTSKQGGSIPNMSALAPGKSASTETLVALDINGTILEGDSLSVTVSERRRNLDGGSGLSQQLANSVIRDGRLLDKNVADQLTDPAQLLLRVVANNSDCATTNICLYTFGADFPIAVKRVTEVMKESRPAFQFPATNYYFIARKKPNEDDQSPVYAFPMPRDSSSNTKYVTFHSEMDKNPKVNIDLLGDATLVTESSVSSLELPPTPWCSPPFKFSSLNAFGMFIDKLSSNGGIVLRAAYEPDLDGRSGFRKRRDKGSKNKVLYSSKQRILAFDDNTQDWEVRSDTGDARVVAVISPEVAKRMNDAEKLQEKWKSYRGESGFSATNLIMCSTRLAE